MGRRELLLEELVGRRVLLLCGGVRARGLGGVLERGLGDRRRLFSGVRRDFRAESRE